MTIPDKEPGTHLEQAEKAIDAGVLNGPGIEARVGKVNAQATLALAHEVRGLREAQEVGNLIALYNMTEANCEGMSTAGPMSRENWDSIAKQIKERLGL